MGGFVLIKAALQLRPDLVTIIMTGQDTIQSAEEATGLGVVDYLPQPFTMRTMIPIVKRALDSENVRKEVANHAASSLSDVLTP